MGEKEEARAHLTSSETRRDETSLPPRRLGKTVALIVMPDSKHGLKSPAASTCSQASASFVETQFFYIPQPHCLSVGVGTCSREMAQPNWTKVGLSAFLLRPDTHFPGFSLSLRREFGTSPASVSPPLHTDSPSTHNGLGAHYAAH
ncbi:unnamed protein product [Protopolystoma xenopodis]|uniref:Uncharacterized protein n=1 Tax=Protopolystoma xenopodis TaxID=117903 RepID=A0A3S5AWR3_9PLAT|nr:unnamed protein product [Protopolystoma xenopodis]